MIRNNVNWMPGRTTWTWMLAALTAISMLLLSPTPTSAQDLKRCKAELREATQIAATAVENAEAATRTASQLKAERDDVTAQRDRYREQRDETRTERDQLAGELAARQNDNAALMLRVEDAATANAILAARVNELESTRWWWLAGGALGGAAIATGLIVWGL